MDVTTATPLEIDTRIAELYTIELELERRERAAMTAIHRGLGEQLQVTGRGINRRETWPTSDDDALAAMQAKGDELIGMMRPASTLVANYTEASAALAANRAEQAPLHAEYRGRGRWTRIFEVAGGHYHRDQNCSTLHRGRERTTLGWRVEFAGADLDKTIVDLAAAAHILCSVCIPNAPVATGPAPVRKSAAQKADDKAAAERKARTEEPKLIADVDGEPLRVDRKTLRTVRAAEIAGVDALWWAAYGRHVGEPNEPYAQKYEGHARQIAAALAHKRGTTPAAELAGMVAKALRKLRKELGGELGAEVAAAAAVVWAQKAETAEPEGILCEPSPAAVALITEAAAAHADGQVLVVDGAGRAERADVEVDEPAAVAPVVESAAPVGLPLDVAGQPIPAGVLVECVGGPFAGEHARVEESGARTESPGPGPQGLGWVVLSWPAGRHLNTTTRGARRVRVLGPEELGRAVIGARGGVVHAYDESTGEAGCAYRNPCEARVVQLLDAGAPVTCTALGCVPHLAQESGAGEDSALASVVAGQAQAGVMVDPGQLLAAVDAYAAAAADLAGVRARQGHEGAAVAGVALARAGVAALLGAHA